MKNFAEMICKFFKKLMFKIFNMIRNKGYMTSISRKLFLHKYIEQLFRQQAIKILLSWLMPDRFFQHVEFELVGRRSISTYNTQLYLELII